MALTEYEAREYARCGLNWVKEHYGDDVPQRIDLTRLDMNDYKYCVLGQLGGKDYYTTKLQFELTDYEAAQLGFEVASTRYQYSTVAEYELLTEAWKELLCEELGLLNE